jgi:hypothetical protein
MLIRVNKEERKISNKNNNKDSPEAAELNDCNNSLLFLILYIYSFRSKCIITLVQESKSDKANYPSIKSFMFESLIKSYLIH